MKNDAEIKALAQSQTTGGPQPGEVYRHYRGGIYSIVARALREDTLEPIVVYHSNLKGVNWERTVANFTETVEFDNQRVPRFERIGC